MCEKVPERSLEDRWARAGSESNQARVRIGQAEPGGPIVAENFGSEN